MNSYRTVADSGEGEYVDRRSRFLAHVHPVVNEKQALALIGGYKQRYWDASHNVFAYILRDGQTRRCSDDGEPQGTAGTPVLEVLQKEDITDALVVVTRYFGGVLLGAGGLVRAYSHAAKIGLDAAGIAVMRPCRLGTITCAYARYDALNMLIRSVGGSVEDARFGTVVILEVALPAHAAAEFERALADVTRGESIPHWRGEEFRALAE